MNAIKESPLLFRFSESSRVLCDWRRERRNGGESVWTAIKRYARVHGAAGVWLADESYQLFYRDGSAIRQRTWKIARPIQE